MLCGTATASPVLEDIQLTRGVNEDSPAWSPDGKKLVYASDQDIWIANEDISGSRKLYGSMSWDGEPALSPDGSRIAYISRIRLTDGKGNERDPSWSPDSKYIVYSFQRNIFKTDVSTGSTFELTNDTFHNTDPEISPNGAWITFVSNRTGNPDIWLMDAQVKGFLRLTSDNGIQKDPSWNPEGKKIAYVSDASGEFNIWVMTLEDELSVFEYIEQEETAADDEKELSLMDKVLTESLVVVIGAATIVVLLFVIFMIRKFLKKVGFF